MTKKKRSIRFVRFRLRTILLCFVPFCFFVSWVRNVHFESKHQEICANRLLELVKIRKSEFKRDLVRRYDSPVASFCTVPFFRHFVGNQLLKNLTGFEFCFQRVSELNLSNSNFCDKDLVILSEFCDLKVLNLDNSEVTSVGLKHLSQLKQLRHLCLGDTEIDDSGIAQLTFLPNLEELELWHSSISDKSIAQLSKLNSLKRLNLCGTKVSIVGINRLQNAIPNCKIWWDANETFALINASPLAEGEYNLNPTSLVRVVNHLSSLKRAECFEALIEYTKVAPGEKNEMSASPYCQSRLCLIMPLLLTINDKSKKIPSPPIIEELKDIGLQFPTTVDEWPKAFIAVEGDIPFHVMPIAASSGMGMPSRRYLVDWANENCCVRTEPLKPVSDPFGAATRLLQKLEAGTTNPSLLPAIRRHVLNQAIEMAKQKEE